jgi:hypothetical protein
MFHRQISSICYLACYIATRPLLTQGVPGLRVICLKYLNIYASAEAPKGAPETRESARRA